MDFPKLGVFFEGGGPTIQDSSTYLRVRENSICEPSTLCDGLLPNYVSVLGGSALKG